ncbi:MAG TPA: 6,7-dimethyl-8-ribityllumazine synthase [Gemmatimonadales bacterium]|nr:6,7-dimethyl-8-ribityllumazine synthase [Gemmatimonadales bacterium]
MPEFSGRLRATGRVAIIVTRYNEIITGKLLEGARACCTEAGVPETEIDVYWVPGAFELPVAAMAAAESDRYSCLIALGAVIRGETPHFDFIAGEATRGLGAVALDLGIPIGFGLLTVNTLEQAQDRAGGSAGNKGHEAAEAALRAADLLTRIDGNDGRP